MSTPTIIKPTIGRKVWYWPNRTDLCNAIDPMFQIKRHDEALAQPLDATVVYVYGDRAVNVVVLDHAGSQHQRCGVPLLQEGDEPPKAGYCQWMPYQTKQAAKQAEPAAPASATVGDTVTPDEVLADFYEKAEYLPVYVARGMLNHLTDLFEPEPAPF